MEKPLDLKSPTLTFAASDINEDYETSGEINHGISSQQQKCLPKAWNRFTESIRRYIQLFVIALSVSAAKYPYICIFATVIISLGMAVAGAMTNLTVNVDPDVLFTPANTITNEHYEWIYNYDPNNDTTARRLSSQRDDFSWIPEEEEDTDSTMDNYHEDLLYSPYQELFHTFRMMTNIHHKGWPLEYTDQHPLHGRKTQASNVASVLSLLVHANGQNVVTQEGMANLFRTYETVIDAVPECRENRRRCRPTSAMRFWNNDIELFENLVKDDQDVIEMLSSQRYEDDTPVDISALAGRAELYPNGTIYYAASYIMLVRLPVRYNPDIFGRNFGGANEDDYERAVFDNVLALREELVSDPNSDYTVEMFTRRAFEDELFRGIAEDVPLLPMVIAIMVGFTSFAFFRWDPVNSKCLLGLGGVTTIVLSILTGNGIMFCCGLPFTPMTTILPFVVLGVGLDDTFIIALAFERTDNKKDPVERVRETMEEVGLTISITTITTTLAFVFGLISSIPSIYWLCMYAFATILIDYIYQITFFVALLVLDSRRIRANRTDCCTCIRVKSRSLPSNSSKSGEQQDNDVSSPSNNGDEEEEEDKGISEPSHVHFADRFMGWYATQLLRPRVKKFVIFIFSAYLALCTYCTTQMEQEFRVSDLTPQESYIQTFFRNMQDYTTRSTAVYIYFRNVDHTDPLVRQDMENYIDDLVALPAFGIEPPFCWVKDFDRIQEMGLVPEDMPFNEKIDTMLQISEIRRVYGYQLIRDRERRVKMSRCIIWFGNLDLYDVQDQLEVFRAQRELSVCYAQGCNDWPYFTWDVLYYLWEFYTVIVQELILTTLSAFIAVLLVTLFVVPHWTAVLYVLPTVLILYIDLIGTLQFVGVRVNAVSYIALVISIGLMVDFILHILVRYYDSKCISREERVKDALQTMGASILLGGLSTFIATIPVLFASSKLFGDIFDSFFALITLSVCHGLILLPVVLSIIGPVGNPGQEIPRRHDHYLSMGEEDTEGKENFGNEAEENSGEKDLIHDMNGSETQVVHVPLDDNVDDVKENNTKEEENEISEEITDVQQEETFINEKKDSEPTGLPMPSYMVVQEESQRKLPSVSTPFRTLSVSNHSTQTFN